MRVIVIGAGDVGRHIATTLSAERHDVTVVDQDAERVYSLRSELDALLLIDGSELARGAGGIEEGIPAAFALGRKLPKVVRRWAGVYSQATNGEVIVRREVADGVHLVTGPGGRGMTMSPAIAEASFEGIDA